jgi:hypothetical protein
MRFPRGTGMGLRLENLPAAGLRASLSLPIWR